MNLRTRELSRPEDSHKWSCRLSDTNSHQNCVNFSLAHLIPPSVDPLPWTAARAIRWKTFANRSAGLSSPCVPVGAPLSRYPPGYRVGHTLGVHRGRARANRAFAVVNRYVCGFFLILRGSARRWRHTVRPPVSRQGRRGACVSYRTLPETAREAHCCNAPPLPALLYQCRSPCGGGRGREGGRRVSGVWSCDFTPTVRCRKQSTLRVKAKYGCQPVCHHLEACINESFYFYKTVLYFTPPCRLLSFYYK